MRINYLLMLFLFSSRLAHADEGPNPLINVKIKPRLIYDQRSGVFTYNYEVFNPPENNGMLFSFDIFLPQSDSKDVVGDQADFGHCPRFAKRSASEFFGTKKVTAVGDTAPQRWTCGYGNYAGYSDLLYGWGSGDDNFIAPGKSLGGFSLISKGLPAIRTAVADPFIDTDKLPASWEGDAEKVAELTKKVRWTGKTIGPMHPPKNFVASSFLDYIISLKSQSVDLGWIPSTKMQGDLDRIFKTAKAHLGPCDQPQLKEDLSELVKKVNENGRALNRDDKDRDQKKGKEKNIEKPAITVEAVALLKFNTEYFLNQLKRPSKDELRACGKDHDRAHEGDRDTR